MNILKYCEFLGDSVILQNLSLKYFPISISVLTACLKLPPNSPLEFTHSLHPCCSQDRYLLSFPSQIHRNCSEIFFCVSNQILSLRAKVTTKVQVSSVSHLFCYCTAFGRNSLPQPHFIHQMKKKPKTPNSKTYRLMSKVTKIWQFSVTTLTFGNQQFLHFIFMKLMQRDCVTHAMLVPALHLTYSSVPQTSLSSYMVYPHTQVIISQLITAHPERLWLRLHCVLPSAVSTRFNWLP